MHSPRTSTVGSASTSSTRSLQDASTTPLGARTSLAATGASARLRSRLQRLEIQLTGRVCSAAPPATAGRNALLYQLARPLRYCTTWWRLRSWQKNMRATNLLVDMMVGEIQRAPVMHGIWLPQATQRVLACSQAIAPLLELAPAQLERSGLLDRMERATTGLQAIAQSRQRTHGH